MANILEGIGNFLQRPSVQAVGQGVLSAIAAGGNPLIGLAAAPVIGAAQGNMRMGRQLAEEEIARRRQRLNAQDQLSLNLEGRVNPITGQPLSAPDPGNPQGVDALKDPSTLGLLSRIAPEKTAQGLLDTFGPGRKPTSIAELEALGIPLDSEEARKHVLGKAGGNSDLLKAFELELMSLQLKNQMAEWEERVRNKAQARKQVVFSVQDEFTRAKEAVDIMQALEGTALGVGTPFSEFMAAAASGGAALADLLGIDADTKKIRTILAQRDRLNKLFAQGFLSSATGLNALGTITDIKFRSISETVPSITNQAAANALLFADNIGESLRGLDLLGESVPNRSEIDTWINRVREQGLAPLTRSAGASQSLDDVLEGLGDMNQDDQAELINALEAYFRQRQQGIN